MRMPESNRSTLAAWAFAALLFAIGLALMFRYALLPGVAWSVGDNGDGTIEIATLEHWVRFVTLRAPSLVSAPWFFPAPGTLGRTDSYALVALPYGLARLAGWGPFEAYNVAIGVLAALGFWGLTALARLGGASPAIGGVFGFVFAFGAMPIFKLGHGQTYTVMLAPWLGLLLVAAWRRRSWGYAAGAGLLFGLLTLTAAQTAWFLGIEAGLLVVVAAVLSGRAGLGGVWRQRGVVMRLGVAASAGLAAGLVPFGLIYAGSFGLRRSWEAVRFYQPNVRDILDVPSGNWLWFDLLHRLGIADRVDTPVAELMLGFTPVLAASGVVAFLVFGRVRRLAGRHDWDVAARACLAVAFLGWLLTIRIGRVDPWHLIYLVVPGASSVRTPFRIQLASSFFLCLGLALFSARALAASRIGGRAGLAAVVGGALALSAVEQLGPPPSGRNTAAMTQWLDAARRPDFPCRAFYVLPPEPGATQPWFEVQSDAILLAVWLGMPTINGNSSWHPEGWDLLFTDRPDYAAKTLDWIDRNGLREQVCGVEPRAGRWVAGIGPLLMPPPAPATPVR